SFPLPAPNGHFLFRLNPYGRRKHNRKPSADSAQPVPGQTRSSDHRLAFHTVLSSFLRKKHQGKKNRPGSRLIFQQGVTDQKNQEEEFPKVGHSRAHRTS